MASTERAMVAMKAASDNAETLIDELTLVYNKNRPGRDHERDFRDRRRRRRGMKETYETNPLPPPARFAGNPSSDEEGWEGKLNFGGTDRKTSWQKPKASGTIVQCIARWFDIEFPARLDARDLYDALVLRGRGNERASPRRASPAEVRTQLCDRHRCAASRSLLPTGPPAA